MPPDFDLSEPELMVLRYASRGLTTGETAVAVGRSIETVKSHRKHARWKLDARTTTQAVAEAIRRYLIP